MSLETLLFGKDLICLLTTQACMLELQVKDLFSSGQWILNLEEQTLETILKREMTDSELEIQTASNQQVVVREKDRWITDLEIASSPKITKDGI